MTVLYSYGLLIMAAAAAFTLMGIEHVGGGGASRTKSILESLIGALMWATSLILSINTEVVNNGTIFQFKSPYLLLFNGVMMGTSIIVAALNYFMSFAEWGERV